MPMNEAEIRATYGKQYDDARAKGDWAAMENINKNANGARGLGNIVTASKDIDYIKSQFGGTPVPNGGVDYRSSSAGSSTQLPTRSSLRSGDSLADLYNITYDRNSIQGIYDDATKAQYDMLRKEYGVTENKFYDKLYGSQATALDTIRRSNASAVATGASRGMQAANELSSVLGLQQESTAGATDLAQQRNLLMDKEGAAYAKNAMDALNTSNQLGMGLGNMASNIYAADTQYDVGMLDYLGRLDTASKNLQGMGLQADANKYGADQNLMGVILNAMRNQDTSLGVANINKDAQLGAAELNNQAQKAYYDWMMKNGGSGGYGGSSGGNSNFKSATQAIADGDFATFAMWFPQMPYNDLIKLWGQAGGGTSSSGKPAAKVDSVSGAAPGGTHWNVSDLLKNMKR